MLGTQSKAPEFVLQDDAGQETALSELLQKGPLILYFYPADFTPGCTREACTIRDLHTELRTAGLQIAGVSPQDPESHARFRARYELPFTLLSDPDKAVIRRYEVDGPLGFGVRRGTYLIGEDGVIEAAVLADLRIGRHEAFIERAIAMRQSAGRVTHP